LPAPFTPSSSFVNTYVPASFKLNEALIVFMVTMGSYQGLCNVYRVLFAESARKAPRDLGAGAIMPPRERGNKQLGRLAAAVHLLALFATLVAGAALLGDENARFVPGLCRAQSALFSVAYAHVATRLIVAHMSKEPFEPGFGTTVLPMVLGVIVSRIPGIVDEVILRPLSGSRVAEALALPATVGATEATCFLLAVATFAYLHYVVVVIRQICAYLDINCLTIKPASAAAMRQAPAAAPHQAPAEATTAAAGAARTTPARRRAAAAK
jgi:hypothetical protein